MRQPAGVLRDSITSGRYATVAHSRTDKYQPRLLPRPPHKSFCARQKHCGPERIGVRALRHLMECPNVAEVVILTFCRDSDERSWCSIIALSGHARGFWRPCIGAAGGWVSGSLQLQRREWDERAGCLGQRSHGHALRGHLEPQGKFGARPVVQRDQNWVTVNASSLLDLTTGMTLAAWVFPTTHHGGARHPHQGRR